MEAWPWEALPSADLPPCPPHAHLAATRARARGPGRHRWPRAKPTNGAAMANEAMERVEEQLQAAKDALADAEVKVRAFVKERPVLCLAGAVAIGYVVGKLVSRR